MNALRTLIPMVVAVAVSGVSMNALGDALTWFVGDEDWDSWDSAVAEVPGTRVDDFPFSPENLAMSNEVALPVVNLDELGNVLTFPHDSGTPLGFRMTVLRGSDWMANLPGPYLIPIGTEDDDWEMEVMTSPFPLIGFGFELYGNDENTGESVSVFDANGQPLAPTLSVLPIVKNTAFVGVVSTEPIGRVLFDEDSTYDDISLKSFRFATVPSPTALAILLALTPFLARRRR